MESAKAKNIDEYIAAFSTDTQKLLEQVRAVIKKTAPEAEEAITYGMPTFKLFGRYLVYFAGCKNHIGFYPVPRGNKAFDKELSKFKGNKGTAQFPLDKPIPVGLITKVVKFRMKENAEKVAKKKTRKVN